MRARCSNQNILLRTVILKIILRFYRSEDCQDVLDATLHGVEQLCICICDEVSSLDLAGLWKEILSQFNPLKKCSLSS